MQRSKYIDSSQCSSRTSVLGMIIDKLCIFHFDDSIRCLFRSFEFIIRIFRFLFVSIPFHSIPEHQFQVQWCMYPCKLVFPTESRPCHSIIGFSIVSNGRNGLLEILKKKLMHFKSEDSCLGTVRPYSNSTLLVWRWTVTIQGFQTDQGLTWFQLLGNA